MTAPQSPGEYRRGGARPCRLCVAELGDLAETYGERPDQATAGLCPLHFAGLPQALREALHRAEDLYRAEWAEAEACAQWSAALQRPIYPGERVDALAYLREKTR